MKDKIAEYKKRRAARIFARLDAKDDNNGRWVTTEENHKIHFNENGVPDKGNPHVIAYMNNQSSGSGKNGHSAETHTNKSGELKSLIENQAADDIADGDYKEGKNKAIKKLNGLSEGTIVKVDDNEYKKVSEYGESSFVNESTGEQMSTDQVYNALETAAIYGQIDMFTGKTNFNMEIIEPEAPKIGGKDIYSKDFANKLQNAFEAVDDYNVFGIGNESVKKELENTINDIPEGTIVKIGKYKFQKYNDKKYPFLHPETGSIHPVDEMIEFIHNPDNGGDIEIEKSNL